MTRTLCSGTPETTDVRNLTICGFCVVDQRVSSPEACVHWATAERGSMAFGIRRWWRILSLTTTSAPAKASSESSPPVMTQLNAWLLGASSWSCGASAPIAFSGSTTAGSGS